MALDLLAEQILSSLTDFSDGRVKKGKIEPSPCFGKDVENIANAF